MKGFLTILKVFATLVVLGVLGGLIFFLKTFQEEYAPPGAGLDRPLEQIVQDNEVIGFEPGQREFNRALQLIALDKLDEALEKLLFIQNLYPDSSQGPEARRILGEINLDRILSVENMSNKKVHIVAPGDGYLKIATVNETTLDSIMFLNGLLDMRALHTGDELIVMPLDFKLVVDLKRARVELFHRDQEKKEHVFVKDYPIRKLDVGRLPGRAIQTKVSRKQGELNGRAFQPTHPSYSHALKVLGFKVGKTFLQLRPVPEADAEEPGRGIFLLASDMEELSMLIRIGNEVEVKPAQ
ncbi:MAG: hypothetical protein QNL33_09135 [Akkermansiaceae bacterium]|jgi:hypothetical protein